MRSAKCSVSRELGITRLPPSDQNSIPSPGPSPTITASPSCRSCATCVSPAERARCPPGRSASWSGAAIASPDLRVLYQFGRLTVHSTSKVKPNLRAIRFSAAEECTTIRGKRYYVAAAPTASSTVRGTPVLQFLPRPSVCEHEQAVIHRALGAPRRRGAVDDAPRSPA